MKHTRLHFWNADKSCYAVTNNVTKAQHEMSSEYENSAVAISQEVNMFDIRLMYEEVQMFDRTNLKGLNNTTENEIFYRFNSHPQLIKALQNVRYWIDEEFQSKDELVPVNIQNVYQILDELFTEKQIEIL